jgi:hypothetical protein
VKEVNSELIRFTLCDYEGRVLPGFSIEMAGPGETREDVIEKLRREFGCRLFSVSDTLNDGCKGNITHDNVK